MGNEQTMTMLELTQITPCAFNPRKTFDKAGLKELEDSVRKQGVLQPILVRKIGQVSKTSPTHYEIICGERRHRAALAAGLKEIPARVVEMDDKTALEVQVIENQQRADLHPLEEAEGYELLMKKHKETADEIAAKVGKSKPYVYQRLQLCKLNKKCRQMFYDGKLTASTALLIARMPHDLQDKAAEDITGDQWSGPLSLDRARERIQRNYMLELKGVAFAKDDSILPERGPCATCTKRTGNQELLFSDIKDGDRCTDPGCFAAKREAYSKAQLEKARKSGRQVLKTEEVFSRDCYNNEARSGFCKLTDCCVDDDKRRTYKDLLAKTGFKPSAVLDKDGNVCEVVKKSDAVKAIKDAGIKLSEDKSKGPQLGTAKVHNRIREAKRGFFVNKVSGSNDRRCMLAVVLNIVLQDLGDVTARDMVKDKIKSKSWGDAWDIKTIYELGEAGMEELLVRAMARKCDRIDDEDLEFLSGKLGFTVAKDYVITKDYLNAMTKDELVALIKELGVKAVFDGDPKKNLLVEVIMKNAPKGKVPAELAPKAKVKK